MASFEDFGQFSIAKVDFPFNQARDVFQFGLPPKCIKILLNVKGLEFESCQKEVYL
jgi:hypothetical protein